MDPLPEKRPAPRGAIDKKGCMIDCATLRQSSLRDRSNGLWSKRPMVVLFGMAATTLLLVARATPQKQDPDIATKTAFWKRLLEERLAFSGALENEPATEQLAQKLALWPDQNKAALLMLDMVADSSLRPLPSSPSSCLPVTLSQLSTPSSVAKSRGFELLVRRENHQQPAGESRTGTWIGDADTERRTRDDQADLELARSLLENNKLQPELVSSLFDDDSTGAHLAHLVVESANFATRLLTQRPAHRELVNSIASPGLFRYFISGRLKGLIAADSALVALGLIHLDAEDQLRFHSMQMGQLEGGRVRDLLPSQFELVAKLALAEGEKIPLRELVTESPFVAKWMLASEDELGRLVGRMGAMPLESDWAGKPSLELKTTDGIWFSPQLECKSENPRWLLFYSLPFFGTRPSDSSIKLRGVCFVALDLARTRLFEQCGETRVSLFGGTHQCARLRGSQCVPLRQTNQNSVRGGGYACQCPPGAQHEPSGGASTGSIRDQLTDLILGRASANSSHALEQLLLDLNGAMYANPPDISSDLLTGSGKERLASSMSYFELGGQLEADSRLAWLAGRTDDIWSERSCNLCQLITTTNSSSIGDNNTSISCSTPTSGRFPIRPLIEIIQAGCALITLFLVGVLLRVRRSRIIVASGWLMLITLLVGAILLYSSVLLHAARRPSPLSCLMQNWLREIGFSFFQGSILMKLYRMLTEFQTRKAHRVCLRDKDQILYLLAFVLVVVCYMSAWTALLLDGLSVSPAPLGQAPAFERLFSQLVESRPQILDSSGAFAPIGRCRKLTWDYVTELSEFAALIVGLRLIYKLRNANGGEATSEKGVLSAAVFLELVVSFCAYSLRHLLWERLSAEHLLILYTVRCQLTVSPTLALIFCPKLWQIGRTRPSFLARAAQAGSAANLRHRCHISCELHAHHLTDAMQLHQAMVSQSGVNIGHINLADMDPDEIKAELKRLYAQLEVMKTKVMRRDNPHISKRRGGRKSSHRKFSLQAFHPNKSASQQHQLQQNQNQLQSVGSASSSSSSLGAHHPARASLAGERLGSEFCSSARLSVPEEADEL